MSSSSPEAQKSDRKVKTKGDKKKRKEDRHKSRATEAYIPQVVTVSFAENEYSGIIQKDHTGARSLEGTSKYTWKSGIKYEGPFVASQIEGRGKFTWPDGSIYEGEISNGKRNGEGVYLADDGVTKYEGHWVEGKRHGVGRISYDTNGDAHYLGQWMDGWKHGEGRQVWPSGNVYEGQWQFGKMAGTGTMSWKDTGMVEVYTGNWEDDQPQGLGTHTWHAPEPKAEVTAKVPSQQMNNRYYGEWHQGVRDGDGTFFYANGATYRGSWSDNVKHGKGKYTFESGKVFSGPFTNDQMKDYTDPMESLTPGAALNIGAQDNPVRRCIDISDLEIIALPPDVGGMDVLEGGSGTMGIALEGRMSSIDDASGYDESQEVMREVHNMLLRYLGELKQCYSQYRKILPRAGDDPFVLSMHQVWTFARDFDLLTPLLNLSSFNRCTLNGPRHHQEAASEEEMQDLRPLTPRVTVDMQRKVSRIQSSSQQMTELTESALANQAGSCGAQGSIMVESCALSFKDSEACSEDSSDYDHDDRSMAPSRSSKHDEEGGPSAARTPTNDDGRMVSPAADSEVASPGLLKTDTRLSGIRASSIAPSVSFLAPLHTKFWRKDPTDLVDIHSPKMILMFRHFLEIFVRVAVARYPNEKGLEKQVCRLFKESLVPRFGAARGSESVFGFLLDPNINQVFESFQPDLWQIFKEHAVGDGVYGPPQWVRTEDPESLYCSEVADGETAKEECPATGQAFRTARLRLKRRGHGGQQRRVHVKARMDVTVRVKDLLHILNQAGLLAPPRAKERYPPFGADINSELFPRWSQGDSQRNITTAESQSNMAPIADLGGLRDLFPAAHSTTPQQDAPCDTFTALETPSNAPSLEQTVAHGSLGSENGGDMSSKVLSPRASARTSQRTFLEAESEEVVEPEVALAEASDSEVLTCDFTLSILEVLQLVSEVSSPDSLQKLCWAVRGETSPADEQLGVLDFVETELSFCEFQRLLVRISEKKTQGLDPVLAEALPLHRRLQGFLRHVLLPAMDAGPKSAAAKLSESQEPPTDAPEGGEQPPAETLETAEAAGADAAPDAAAETDAGEDTPAEACSTETRPFTLWQGFDDGDLYGLEEIAVPRAWPEDYDQSVIAW